MAPEFCRGKVYGHRPPITAAADVFSLGIIVLETFLGHLPYADIPFPPHLLEAELPRGMADGPAKKKALQDAMWHNVMLALAHLGSSIPEPGSNKVWDCFQTGNPVVDRLVLMCCHPDPQQRASASQIAAFLAQEVRQLGGVVAAEPQLKAAAPARTDSPRASQPNVCQQLPQLQQAKAGKLKQLLKKCVPFEKMRRCIDWRARGRG